MEGRRPVAHTERFVEVMFHDGEQPITVRRTPIDDPSAEVLARVDGAAPDLRPGMLANVGIDDRR